MASFDPLSCPVLVDDQRKRSMYLAPPPVPNMSQTRVAWKAKKALFGHFEHLRVLVQEKGLKSKMKFMQSLLYILVD